MKIKSKIKPYVYRGLRFLRFIPDTFMLSFLYYIRLHRWPDLKTPKRFTEWMQWYKAKYRNEEMLKCTDKYIVRDYVESKGEGKLLNSLYQVCTDANEIDFDSLPSQFVIKTSDGGNGDNIYICRDKSKIDRRQIINRVNAWRNKHYEQTAREWAYAGATESKIIIEKFLEDKDNSDGSIDDYKFLCFGGKFKVLWVDKDRYSNHRRGFWDENLSFMYGVSSDHPTFDVAPTLPCNIGEMILIAEKLAEDFPFARVDLYNIQGKIIFGEITFYPWSGFVQYNPDSFDFYIGQYFSKAVDVR